MEVLKDRKTNVYKFGNQTTEGNSLMKNLLGAKGAHLS
jgi:pyruvate,orthophosphate dikinase